MAAEALSVVYSVPGRLGVGGMGRGVLASVRAALSSGWSVSADGFAGDFAPALARALTRGSDVDAGSTRSCEGAVS